jgi:hypothetical protein
VSRAGYVQKEIGFALDVAEEQPEGALFLIPVRLEECDVPERLRRWQWADLFADGGFERLQRALLIRAEKGGLKLSSRSAGKQRKSTKARGNLNKGATSTSTRRKKTEPGGSGPVRILHISDLNFRSDSSATVSAQQLLTDLRLGIRIEAVQYLVVTGDISDRCNAAGYEVALEFLAELRYELKIPIQACIIVPGNHDLSFDIDAYVLSVRPDGSENTVQQGDIYLLPDGDRYPRRFEQFAKFYQDFTGVQYPLDPGRQVVLSQFEDSRVQFMALNSAWQIDRFHSQRSSINTEALSRGLKSAQSAMEYFRIAVWHHAVTGNQKIRDAGFIEALCQNGFHLCLHGDVHEFRPDTVNPYEFGRMHVVGAGSFAARAQDRPESTPRLYNLLEIDRDRHTVRVRTRAQISEGSSWRPYAVWPVADNPDMMRAYYEFGISSD